MSFRDVQNVAEGPRFARLAGPATKSCCGATLRSGMFAIAFFEVLMGFSGMMSGTLYGVLQLLLGIVAFAATLRLDASLSHFYYMCCLIRYVLSVFAFVLVVVFLIVFHDKVEDAIEEHMAVFSSDRTALMLGGITLVIITSLLSLIISGYLLYIIWSFDSFLKRGATHVVVSGINEHQLEFTESPQPPFSEIQQQQLVVITSDGGALPDLHDSTPAPCRVPPTAPNYMCEPPKPYQNTQLPMVYPNLGTRPSAPQKVDDTPLLSQNNEESRE